MLGQTGAVFFRTLLVAGLVAGCGDAGTDTPDGGGDAGPPAADRRDLGHAADRRPDAASPPDATVNPDVGPQRPDGAGPDRATPGDAAFDGDRDGGRGPDGQRDGMNGGDGDLTADGAAGDGTSADALAADAGGDGATDDGAGG